MSFVGDLSLEDANYLAGLAKLSPRILEFGVGGSTMIFAQSFPQKLVSVETDQSWIDRTSLRMRQIEKKTSPEFHLWPRWPKEQFDLIFVDGVDAHRREFALDTWDSLSENGVMVFHDTRRLQDFQNAAYLAQLHHNSICRIEVNAHQSNLTAIFKQPHQPYINWNYSEGKPLWAYGLEESPDGKLWQL